MSSWFRVPFPVVYPFSMTHCYRRGELCQRSSPRVQIWTVRISNDESHLCSAPQLMKYFDIIILLLSPITLWYRQWGPVRSPEKHMEPGPETRPAGSRSNAFLLWFIWFYSWRGNVAWAPLRLCVESLGCGKDTGRVIWANSLRHFAGTISSKCFLSKMSLIHHLV